MAHRDGASSVLGNAIRITRLLVDGSIDTGFPILTTRGFISATFSPEFEEGDEISEKRADGGVCISWKADDTLKRLNFSLSLCSPDPEAAALLAGGKIICDVDGNVIGYTSPEVGSVVGNPVAVEIWSTANIGGKPAAGTPYWHWVFPYVKVRYDGDREFGNAALSNEFTGQALGNTALVTAGLNPLNSGDDWVTYKEALVNPFSYVRSAALPVFGWTEGSVGEGSAWPHEAEYAIGECALEPALPPVATIEAAPVAGPIEGNEGDGTIIVATGSGDIWIVRLGEWVDSGVTAAPVPAAVAIVTANPTLSAPAGSWADDDIVFYDDGTSTYKGYLRDTGAWVATAGLNVSKT